MVFIFSFCGLRFPKSRSLVIKLVYDTITMLIFALLQEYLYAYSPFSIHIRIMKRQLRRATAAPTTDSAFQCVKVDLPRFTFLCGHLYTLKRSSQFFFFFFFCWKRPTLAHRNYCSALSTVVPPRYCEWYTNCLSIIYVYSKLFFHFQIILKKKIDV